MHQASSTLGTYHDQPVLDAVVVDVYGILCQRERKPTKNKTYVACVAKRNQVSEHEMSGSGILPHH
jgi:hypothetical protein